jgi:very-short-patch-repair endonuclease
MSRESPVATLSRLSAPFLGVFRGRTAVEHGLSRNQLGKMQSIGVIDRLLPDTYRMTVVPPSNEQALRAALLWAGPLASAAGRSAGETYGLEGVHAARPEILVPRRLRPRSDEVVVYRSDDRAAQMIRKYRDIRVTGVEPTIVALARVLDAEALEIACEDARRRRLTSVPGLRAYLLGVGCHRPGVAAVRSLLDEIDPKHAARSTLEVKTRRLLIANGFTDFVREFPLERGGRRYRFDFVFARRRVILETNGRRWHDDATDYERDNEKWSVPGLHGYRLIFATWDKVTRRPRQLLAELAATLAA